jgi:hypothetical protein
VLTAADTRQTVVVPPATVILVRLEPVDGTRWTVPESSDPHALPRLSASGACADVKEATFRADASGWITATRPYGPIEFAFNVTVQVADRLRSPPRPARLRLTP